MVRSIPAEDLKHINDTFKGGKGQILTKGKSGGVIHTDTKIINPSGFVIKNYSGRVFKRNKFYIDQHGRQIHAAKIGQKFDGVSKIDLDRIQISDEDFE